MDIFHISRQATQEYGFSHEEEVREVTGLSPFWYGSVS
jgi:hypothetical protein